MKNNRYMSGMELLKKGAKALNNLRPAVVANKAVDGARKAKRKYDKAWKAWQASPRHKEGVRRAKNEG